MFKKLGILAGSLLLFLFFFYLLLPKGYVFLILCKRLGIEVYAKKVEEGFFKARLYQAKVLLPSGIKEFLGEVSFPEVEFTGYSVFIPSKKGFLKVFYKPLNSIEVVLKDFSIRGKSLGTFSGRVKFVRGKGGFGKISSKQTGIIEFKGKKVCLNSHRFHHCWSWQ